MSEIDKVENFIKDVEENDWDESEYKALLKEAILIIKYFCNEAYVCPHCENEITLDDLENSKIPEEDDYENEEEDEDEPFAEVYEDEDEDDYDYEDVFAAALENDDEGDGGDDEEDDEEDDYEDEEDEDETTWEELEAELEDDIS